jgi:hypothetical protein
LIFCTLMTMHEAVISAKMYERNLECGGSTPHSDSRSEKVRSGG